MVYPSSHFSRPPAAVLKLTTPYSYGPFKSTKYLFLGTKSEWWIATFHKIASLKWTPAADITALRCRAPYFFTSPNCWDRLLHPPVWCPLMGRDGTLKKTTAKSLTNQACGHQCQRVSKPVMGFIPLCPFASKDLPSSFYNKSHWVCTLFSKQPIIPWPIAKLVEGESVWRDKSFSDISRLIYSQLEGPLGHWPDSTHSNHVNLPQSPSRNLLADLQGSPQSWLDGGAGARIKGRPIKLRTGSWPEMSFLKKQRMESWDRGQ